MMVVVLLVAIAVGARVFMNIDTKKVSKACIEDICFSVELARTQAEQESGLMNRAHMEERHGMLFIFPQRSRYDFRMKDTLIPLDMIWIDEDRTVVRTLNAQPCTADPCMIYSPGVDAKYVLEINSGMVAKYGIQEGAKIRFVNIQDEGQ